MLITLKSALIHNKRTLFRVCVLLVITMFLGTHVLLCSSKWQHFMREEDQKTLHGSTGCSDLLHHGQWRNDTWQPCGCNLHYYTKGDTKWCMESRARNVGSTRMVFLGDSRTQEMFYRLALHFKNSVAFMPHTDIAEKFLQWNFTLESRFRKYLDGYYSELFREWINSEPGRGRPDIIVAGLAAWYIRYHKLDKSRDVAFQDYKKHLRAVSPLMKILASTGTRIIWKLQDPSYEPNLGPDPIRRNFTNWEFNRYNDAAQETFRGSMIEIWNSSRTVAYRFVHQQNDGIHFRDNFKCQNQVQILLNLFCNSITRPKDSQCCTAGHHQQIPVTEVRTEVMSLCSTLEFVPLQMLILFTLICLIAFWYMRGR